MFSKVYTILLRNLSWQFPVHKKHATSLKVLLILIVHPNNTAKLHSTYIVRFLTSGHDFPPGDFHDLKSEPEGTALHV